MKKILTTVKENTKVRSKLHYIIIILVSLFAAIPLIKMQIMFGDDGTHHLLRVIGMAEIFKIGEFPPFIQPEYCNNWGYAMNLFYGPIVTYGPYFFKLFTQHYYDALKIFSLLTIIVSGFTMYACVYEISKKREIALLSSIIYILFPYKLETIYNRFAIGEFAAYMFLPLVFLGLYNLINEDGKKHYYIAIGAIGLILTHAITTEYTAIFSIIYILFNIKELKKKGVIKKILINIIVILSVTAFFTIPLLEHKMASNYAIFSPSLMRSKNIDVQANTIYLWQLFVDESGENIVSFKIGAPIIVLLITGIFTCRKNDEEIKRTYILSSFFAAISIIMCITIFPWRILPDFLCTLQYPWRMLTFFGFFISIVCGINAYTLINYIVKANNLNKNILLIISIILICVLSIPMITRYHVDDADLKKDQEYESKILSNLKISHMQINRDYLTKNAIMQQWTYLRTREDKVYVLSGNADIINENKKELNLTFNIENGEKGTILELPYLYYLGYDARIETDNTTIKVKTVESKNGFVSIELPQDIVEAKIVVQYKGTVLEKVSYIISICSVVVCIIYICYKKHIDKKEENVESK